MKILVSACLLGKNCKYNGGNNGHPAVEEFLRGHEVIPVCPEVMGGLPIPREPAEICGGQVINRKGVSVDREYRRGAELTLEIARRERPDLCLLQARSPSCGALQIYDGSFSGTLKAGMGITAELLRKEGFRILDSGELLKTWEERQKE